jgi:hypothetical protein
MNKESESLSGMSRELKAGPSLVPREDLEPGMKPRHGKS